MPYRIRFRQLTHIACIVALMLCAAPALAAGCGRTIVTPLAPVGISVVADGDKLSGIYPAILKKVTASTGCMFKTYVVPQARL